METFDKKSLTERDICTKFITPAIVETAGWNRGTQIREELSLTKGKIQVRGKLYSRGKQKRADYVLYHKMNIPLAVISLKQGIEDGFLAPYKVVRIDGRFGRFYHE